MPDYSIDICDLTGESIEEVPASDLQYTFKLNDIGSVSFQLPLHHPKCTYELLTPGQRTVLVYRNGALAWGGRLWSAQVSEDGNTVQFGGNDWLSILQRRFIDVTQTFTQIDQLVIAWNLINFTQGKTNGDIGIQRFNPSQTSGKLRDRTYFDYERKEIAEALQELAAVIDGFDFEITPDRQWKTYYPRKGQATDTPFELGKNIRGYSVAYDATSVENEISAFGSGQGAAQIVSVASDASSKAVYGLLQGNRSFTDVSIPATLSGKAQEELRLSKDTLVRPEFSALVTDDPAFGAYSVGDSVRVKIKDGYYVNIDQRLRISTITVAVANTGFEAVGLFFDNELG